MDDTTRWQDAAHPADSQLIGPALPTPPETGYDELETGIASIFAALQAAGPEPDPNVGSGESVVHESDGEAIIFTLLGELDRLWQRAAL